MDGGWPLQGMAAPHRALIHFTPSSGIPGEGWGRGPRPLSSPID
jgi:hypothetical protein